MAHHVLLLFIIIINYKFAGIIIYCSKGISFQMYIYNNLIRKL